MAGYDYGIGPWSTKGKVSFHQCLPKESGPNRCFKGTKNMAVFQARILCVLTFDDYNWLSSFSNSRRQLPFSDQHSYTRFFHCYRVIRKQLHFLDHGCFCKTIRLFNKRFSNKWAGFHLHRDRSATHTNSSPVAWQRVHENTVRNLLKGFQQAEEN